MAGFQNRALFLLRVHISGCSLVSLPAGIEETKNSRIQQGLEFQSRLSNRTLRRDRTAPGRIFSSHLFFFAFGGIRHSDRALPWSKAAN